MLPNVYCPKIGSSTWQVSSDLIGYGQVIDKSRPTTGTRQIFDKVIYIFLKFVNTPITNL